MITCLEEALQELGLPKAAQAPPTPDEVRRAFRRQALLWHPDKQNRRAPTTADSGDVPGGEAEQGAAAAVPGAAEERFKRLASAYHLLLLHASAPSSAGPRPPPEARSQPPPPPQQQQHWHEQQQQQQQGADAEEEERLADALSAELLLQASRLRLPDFDMIFLCARGRVCVGGPRRSGVIAKGRGG
ncbi:hypothetical protein TSOC_015184, partial [Tetrabaena socialis]